MKKFWGILIVGLLWCGTSFAESSLPPCEGEDYKQYTNCFGSYKGVDFPKGLTIDYTGEFGDSPGKAHGRGTVKFYLNGEFKGEYTGEVIDDKQHGQGTLTWANGNKYVGEFIDDKRHGQGTLTFASGDKYVGEYKDGKENGQGTMTWSDGKKYVGEWKDSERHGQGTFTYADGNKYVGEYKDGQQHGQGTFTWANGDKYVGEWKDAELNGQGTFTWANGNKYVGEFIDGKQHGQGTMTSPDGDKYVGEWKDAIPNGQGTRTWSDGNKYVGKYKDGQQHGQGTLTYPDGTVDEGIWENDKFVKKIPKEPKDSGREDTEIVPAASGTGFFVSRNGHIITNHHVIDGCKAVKANFKGSEIEAIILAIDKTNDLAILQAKITPKKVFSVSNEDVSLLEDIIVAGFPLGKRVSATIKTHKGSVTALAGLGDNYSNFQTDATINVGNSGGPVIDQKGNVVGVAVALMPVESGQNIFFAVKSSTLKAFANSNGLQFLSPNNRDLSNKDLGQLITDATVYLECWMTFAKIKELIAREENRKAFYSEYK